MKAKFKKNGITRKQLEGMSTGGLLLALILLFVVYYLIYIGLIAMLPVLFSIFGVALSIGQAKAIVITLIMIRMILS